MTTDIQATKVVRTDYRFRRRPSGTTIGARGHIAVPRIAMAIFDTAANDSSGASNKTVAAHGLGLYLPLGAIVTRAWYQVKTTFTSGTSAATIALKANAANDLVSAIAISDGTTPWSSAANHGALPGSSAEATVAGDTAVLAAARTAGSFLGPMSAEKELTATVGVEALTAGKLILFVEFVQGL